MGAYLKLSFEVKARCYIFVRALRRLASGYLYLLLSVTEVIAKSLNSCFITVI